VKPRQSANPSDSRAEPKKLLQKLLTFLSLRSNFTYDQEVMVMLRAVTRLASAGLLALLILGRVYIAEAQVGTTPSVNCQVTDGQFIPCLTGQTEWSDVEPVRFLAADSYLYVNQDKAHTVLYLMYDFLLRTSPIAPTESVQVNFDTDEQGPNGSSLEQYVVNIFGSGTIQVTDNGQTIDPGRITGAVGFHVSPNSALLHLMAEPQVPLTPSCPTVRQAISFSVRQNIFVIQSSPGKPLICGEQMSPRRSALIAWFTCGRRQKCQFLANNPNPAMF
jgi:hypothetical protein